MYIYLPKNKNAYIIILVKRKEVTGEWKEFQSDDSQMTEKNLQYEIYLVKSLKRSADTWLVLQLENELYCPKFLSNKNKNILLEMETNKSSVVQSPLLMLCSGKHP
jgi:hypothetical protein